MVVRGVFGIYIRIGYNYIHQYARLRHWPRISGTLKELKEFRISLKAPDRLEVSPFRDFDICKAEQPHQQIQVALR